MTKKGRVKWLMASIRLQCGCILEIDGDEFEVLNPGDWDYCDKHGDQQIVRVGRVSDV